MGRLDYEKVRRYSLVSDGATDDLPPAGSWADQRRYRTEYDCRSEVRTPQRRNGKPTRTSGSQTTQEVVKQLTQYVVHAEHCDFTRKSTAQRAEIIEIIQRLLLRSCRTTDGNPAQQGLLAFRAQRLIARYTH